MKKLFFIIILVGIIIIGGMIFMAYKDDQIAFQYTDEVISKHKRELDFSPFDKGLSGLSSERRNELDQLIFEVDIEVVQSYVKEGKLTCEELVLYYIGRIKQYNNTYNAVIQLNPKALEQARVLDEKFKSGESMGALFGSAVLLKDNIAALDINVAAGTYALKDTTSERDAYIVQVMKSKDCLVLGKANLSEWSNFMSDPSSNGFSVLGGQTKNPYGQFDVGGSSSGPSVGAAMNLASFTIGSETCGSLIYPAGQNSIATVKPTIGLISRDLVIPITEAQDTLGPMTRNISDLMFVYPKLIEKDQNDPKSSAIDSVEIDTTLNKDYLKGKRLGVANADEEGMKRIIEEIESMGATVVPVTFSDESQAIDMLSVLLYGIKHDVNDFLNHPAINSEFKSLAEIITYYKEDEKRMPYGQHYLEQGESLELSKEDYLALVEKNEKITREALDSTMEDENLDGFISISNELALLYAVAGYPAVTLPAGYEESGEPYGVTFVAGYNDDFKLIQMAYGYEQNTNHRVPPKY